MNPLSLDEIVVGQAIRKLQEGLHKLMADLQVPDVTGSMDKETELIFRADVLDGISIARWWTRFMRMAVRGNDWEEPGIALEDLEDWMKALENFCTDEKMQRIGHSRICKGNGCRKYMCNFHRTNGEKSLKVYTNYIEYERDNNGELTKSWYLNQPYY